MIKAIVFRFKPVYYQSQIWRHEVYFYFLSLWTKSYGVTLQMKPLQMKPLSQYCCMPKHCSSCLIYYIKRWKTI